MNTITPNDRLVNTLLPLLQNILRKKQPSVAIHWKRQDKMWDNTTSWFMANRSEIETYIADGKIQLISTSSEVHIGAHPLYGKTLKPTMADNITRLEVEPSVLVWMLRGLYWKVLDSIKYDRAKKRDDRNEINYSTEEELTKMIDTNHTREDQETEWDMKLDTYIKALGHYYIEAPKADQAYIAYVNAESREKAKMILNKECRERNICERTFFYRLEAWKERMKDTLVVDIND